MLDESNSNIIKYNLGEDINEETIKWKSINDTSITNITHDVALIIITFKYNNDKCKNIYFSNIYDDILISNEENEIFYEATELIGKSFNIVYMIDRTKINSDYLLSLNE